MKQDRIAVTIRFPKPVLEQAKALTNQPGSFNDLVVKALEREVRVRYALSDSTPVIRQLREGIGRWD